MERGSRSIPSITVAPVVVSPDTDSNTASVTEQQWDTAAQSQRNPEHHDDDEAVAQAKLTLMVPHR
jgi:hypothetical protein